VRAGQNLEIVKLGKVSVGHPCNVWFDTEESQSIIIHARRDGYITSNRMPSDKKEAPPEPPRDPKPALSKDIQKPAPEKDEGAEPDSPAGTDTPPTRDLNAIIAPLSHEQLVQLRSRIDSKLPPIPESKSEPGPTAQTSVLLMALLASITSLDPAALGALLTFGPLSRTFGWFLPSFALFALAPAFLPFVLFVFADPARNAIDKTAHELGDVLALVGPSAATKEKRE